MKRIIALIVLIFVVLSSFGQPGKTSPALTKEKYQLKSKKQKMAAWLFLSAGSALGIVGLTQINLAGSDEEINNGAGTVLFLTGTAAVITSIPFFIASKKNKQRAASISFRMEKSPVISTVGLGYKNYPAIAYRFNIQ